MQLRPVGAEHPRKQSTDAALASGRGTSNEKRGSKAAKSSSPNTKKRRGGAVEHQMQLQPVGVEHQMKDKADRLVNASWTKEEGLIGGKDHGAAAVAVASSKQISPKKTLKRSNLAPVGSK